MKINRDATGSEHLDADLISAVSETVVEALNDDVENFLPTNDRAQEVDENESGDTEPGAIASVSNKRKVSMSPVQTELEQMGALTAINTIENGNITGAKRDLAGAYLETDKHPRYSQSTRQTGRKLLKTICC
jgi:hypothetical protein